MPLKSPCVVTCFTYCCCCHLRGSSSCSLFIYTTRNPPWSLRLGYRHVVSINSLICWCYVPSVVLPET